MSEDSLGAGRAIDLLDQADKALAATVSRFSEADLRAPSLCEGWTRAHVLAHLARNADALQRLIGWAVYGRETPAYDSMEQRDRDIEEGAEQPLGKLRADVASASAAFRTRVEQLRGHTSLHQVSSGRGVPLPGDQIPWARLREVTFHHVDLDAGFSFSDAPPEVVRAGLYEAVARINSRGGGPHVTLHGSDNRHWNLGGGGHVVSGRTGDLLLWLSRGIEHNLTHDHPLPTIPSWG